MDKTNLIREFMDRENLFFAGFILFLFRCVMVTTMIPMPGIVGVLCVLLSIALIGLKIILYDGYSLPSLTALILGILGIVAVLYKSRYVLPVFWFFLIVGSKDISFRKILKVYLIVTSTIMLAAFVMASFDVIENLQYITEKRGIRNSFGAIYPTDFAAHVFFLLLTYAYLKSENLKYSHCLVFMLVAAVTYHFCNTRLDSSSILLLALLFGFGKFVTQNKRYIILKQIWIHFWEKAGMWIMTILAGISIAATYLFNPGNSFWSNLDKIVSSRLKLGQKGLEEYGVKLWGQVVEMNGFGGSTKKIEEYFFIDCSYVLALLRYGIIFLLVLLAVYTMCCYKKRKDLYFLYAIALVAINCTISHHIIDIAYNPFALALLADCGKETSTYCGLDGRSE